MHHVGVFAELEDEMVTWLPGSRSPNRMDGLVWGATAALAPIMSGPDAGKRKKKSRKRDRGGRGRGAAKLAKFR